MNRRHISYIFICAILLIAVIGGVTAEQLPVVTGVEIKGLRRIEEGAVKTKLSQKMGETLSQEKTTEDIKAIYKMGYFDDVNVGLEPFEGGIKVIYTVKEKPTIIKVDFQGNEEFKAETLKEKIGITAGAISDITLINNNAGKLKVFYEDEGYYLAKIVPVMNKTDEGEVVLTYHITEGEKVKIREIKIENNSALSAGKIKKVMKTTERGLLSFILGTGYYKRTEMLASIESIKDLYHENGYIAVVVGEPKIQLIENDRGMRISITVSEGDQYKVSSIAVAGNKVYKESEIREKIKLKNGSVFNKTLMKSDVASISDKYSDTGYALVSINPELDPNKDKKTVDVVYKISEGDKYKMGKIDISGNTKTKDKVVRREIRVDEGETYSSSKIKRSLERLKGTNFFETVDITPKPRVNDKAVDLDVKVKDKPTGAFTLGGGYGSEGPLAMVEVSQSNLMGTGRYLSAGGQIGTRMKDASIKYRDPWFLDQPVQFGLTLYKNVKKYPAYYRDAIGGEISLGRDFWEYWHISATYNLERAKTYNIDANASAIVKEQEGSLITSSITPAIFRDTRDNRLDPMSGSKNLVSATFAGLGGDNRFVRLFGETGWYFPVFDVTALHLRGRAGWIVGVFGKKVPLYERFYLGGIDTLRGFAFGRPGPRDVKGEAIGGDVELIMNAEYIFPIMPDIKLKGVVFYDAGNAYDSHDKSKMIGSDLRSTAGGGIRWQSPLGPIRVEYGVNIFKRRDEGFGRVEFGMGSAF